MFIFIHQTGSNINKKLNYKHLIKYYIFVAKLEKNPFTIEKYRNFTRATLC